MRMRRFYVLDWFVEYWLPVKGYEGLYEVSNWGRVKSVDRYIRSRWNCERKINGQIIEPRKRGDYYAVTLWTKQTQKTFSVHRLVAEAFIPNPQNLPCVNHKSEGKTENQVWNLEWCTAKYNCNYGTKIERSCKKKSKPVLQYTKNGQFIAKYLSIKDAAEKNDIHQSKISLAVNGKRKSAGGFIWKYPNSQANPQ